MGRKRQPGEKKSGCKKDKKPRSTQKKKKINPVKIIKKERLEKVHQKVTDHYGCSTNISVAIHSTSH